jgi:peptidoglycan/LPS O-acetylase OafA/YrhL
MYAAASMPVVYGLVCLSSLDHGTPRIRTDWQKMLGTLGLYSYSVYLFHKPIEHIAVRISLKITGNDPGIGTVWLVVVFTTGLGLGVGLLAGHYVEMPLLEWCKKRIAGLKLNTRTAVREA